jgi:hypothetical protein
MKSTLEASGPETLPMPVATPPLPTRPVEDPVDLDPDFSAWLEELL